MNRLQRILVPTDFSTTANAALTYGIELARVFGARLDLLHVSEHPEAAAEMGYPLGLVETVHNVHNTTVGRLRTLVTENEARELSPEYAMRVGTASNEIVGYEKEHDIDLIVMGTHGRSGVTRVVLGSVAERVVRKAPCPVLTVHNPEHEFVVPDTPAVRSPAATP